MVDGTLTPVPQQCHRFSFRAQVHAHVRLMSPVPSAHVSRLTPPAGLIVRFSCPRLCIESTKTRKRPIWRKFRNAAAISGRGTSVQKSRQTESPRARAAVFGRSGADPSPAATPRLPGAERGNPVGIGRNANGPPSEDDGPFVL